MIMNIGPSIFDELAEAGVGGVEFSVNENGITFNLLALTPEQQLAVTSVVAAHTPDGSIQWQKDRAKRKIDTLASEIRSLYITSGVGQELTYLYKAEECQRFQANGYPEGELDDYPWVKAEKMATGYITAQQAVDEILAAAELWVTIGSTIERYRRQGKISIDSKSTKADIDHAYDLTAFALNSLRPMSPVV
jgi:hypothetical protein